MKQEHQDDSNTLIGMEKDKQVAVNSVEFKMEELKTENEMQRD